MKEEPFGFRLLALVGVFALVVAACTSEDGDVTTMIGGDTTATSTGDGEGEPPPQEVVALRVGLVSNITTDNWWAAFDTEDSTTNQAWLGNGKTALFTLSMPGFVHVPAAAATATPPVAAQEGDVWVVKQPIRRDMTWSDGTPVTANDLVFYFDTVREFSLGSGHAANFPRDVLSLTAPDDYTVRIEFESEPGLTVWSTGVGFAPFVPSHFWRPIVEEARVASQAVSAGITVDEATQHIIDVSLADDDSGNDLTAEDVTSEMISDYRINAGVEEAISTLYRATGIGEPSVGPVVVDRWEPGAFAVTTANDAYHDKGSEKTLYSDGSFRIANSRLGENGVYGGEGTGDIVARYVEGPFVDEVVWVEHATRQAAYESLAAGELDLVYDPPGLTTRLRNELAAANPSLRFFVSQNDGFRYLAFNMRKAPMSDRAFRRAVATIIDKEFVADTVLAGSVFPGYTIIHPDLIVHHNDDVDRPGWSEGVPMSEAERFVTAVEILRNQGYTWDVEPVIDDENPQPVVTPGQGLTMPNGAKVPELTVLAPDPGSDPFRAEFSIWIQQWLNDLGVPAIVEQTDFEVIVDAVFPPQTPDTSLGWDMYLGGWAGADPSLPGAVLVAFFHSREDAVFGGGYNTPGFDNEAFDDAADSFLAASDTETAAALTKEMEAIIAEELPYVVLFRSAIIEAYHDRVEFPVDMIMGGMIDFPKAWLGSVRVVE